MLLKASVTIIATLPARFTHVLRGIARREQVERELRREIEGHLDMLAERKVSEGMSAGEARHTATLEFGAVDEILAQVRDTWLSTSLQRARGASRFWAGVSTDPGGVVNAKRGDSGLRRWLSRRMGSRRRGDRQHNMQT